MAEIDNPIYGSKRNNKKRIIIDLTDFTSEIANQKNHIKKSKITTGNESYMKPIVINDDDSELIEAIIIKDFQTYNIDSDSDSEFEDAIEILESESKSKEIIEIKDSDYESENSNSSTIATRALPRIKKVEFCLERNMIKEYNLSDEEKMEKKMNSLEIKKMRKIYASMTRQELFKNE
jgi:hypothetical protein